MSRRAKNGGAEQFMNEPVLCECDEWVELNETWGCGSCRRRAPVCRKCQDAHQSEVHGANDD